MQARGDQEFWFVFRCKGKILLTLFATTFFHMATEKKFQSPVGTIRKKLISDPETVQ